MYFNLSPKLGTKDKTQNSEKQADGTQRGYNPTQPNRDGLGNVHVAKELPVELTSLTVIASR